MYEIMNKPNTLLLNHGGAKDILEQLDSHVRQMEKEDEDEY